MLLIHSRRQQLQKGFPTAGIFIPIRTIFITLTVVATVIVSYLDTIAYHLGAENCYPVNSYQSVRDAHVVHHPVTVSSLRTQKQQCRFYYARTATENGDFGIFAGVGLHPGDTISFPDICISLEESSDDNAEHDDSTYWHGETAFVQHEGMDRALACEGIGTAVNRMPAEMETARFLPPPLPTTAGLHRDTHPGAGAITPYYGLTSVAVDIVTAGSEITYREDVKKEEWREYNKPERPVSALKKHGWCIDHIEVRPQATDPHMGRGLFATKLLPKGSIVTPAPLLVHPDDSAFQTKGRPPQLMLNYCFKPPNSNMLLYPYGPGLNVINHNGQLPNVGLQWSKNPLHNKDMLRLSLDEFHNNVYPGALILEVVALRNIQPGEELFLDYGTEWEEAWKKHVQEWKSPPGASSYVYPEEMDETEALRTLDEQKTNPYPPNLATMCNTPDWERQKGNRITWYQPGQDGWDIPLVHCYILAKEIGMRGDFVYTVALDFEDKFTEYDPSVPIENQYIDDKVPRRAIRFIEKPFMDDEHLPGVFRHAIGLPDNLTPPHWKTKIV